MTGQMHVSTVSRARHRVRMHVSEHPRVYLPFARRKYPGPSPEVVRPDHELVIEGYTRSAMTYAVYALQLAQDRPVRLAHHLHAPAQLIKAVQFGVPALVLIRDPKGACLSQVVREPDVALQDALLAYSRFYERILPYRDGYVIADFDEVTQDFAAVVRRLNSRFGTFFKEFERTEANERECARLIKERGSHSAILLGFETGTVTRAELEREFSRIASAPKRAGEGEAWVPSPDREAAKAAYRAQLDGDALSPLRRRAESAYSRFLAS